jgi:hypothetical protein
MMVGLLDRDGAAVYLSTSPGRVDELRRSGRLLSVLDDRVFKYLPADLDRYIASLPYAAKRR